MKKWTAILALITILVMVVPVSAQQPGRQVPDSPDAGAKVWIVRMADAPVVAYDGSIPGLQATKPGNGQKINPNSAHVKKYVRYLEGKHDKAAAAVGAAKFYSYVYSLNGFAAVMTSVQAGKLKANPDVVQVWADEFRQPTTDNSPTFMGLTAEGGLWDTGLTGEDVIVGVIDTGIWPEHPSFSDQIDLVDRPGESGKRTRAFGPPPEDWYGTCQSGERWSQDDCNYKLIGARYFKDGFTNNEINISGDYLSARDADGHGSHTSSTAAGNAGVPASILGSDLGTISGMAPRARVAMYKACWADAGCATSDLAAAIDQAVADGVDVINYSIGSSGIGLSADEIAFLFAADAGVFVADSAGNSGPGAATTGSPTWVPWITSTGANYQDRTFQSHVTLGNGSTYTGLGLGVTGELPLVDAADAGDELCNIGALDSSVVAGKIVLCMRGAIPLVYKSQAVLVAGGAGMILYNSSAAQNPYLTSHAVPTAHITDADGLAIKDYIEASAGEATATIDGGHAATRGAPWMVDFSSRGPNRGAYDIIKPDVTAPGFGILAAYSPTPFLGAPGELFAVIQGTSMAAPHTAGIAALLKEAHPDWSPAMLKSALMTTADPNVLKEDGATPATPFDMGAGHLNPNPAVDPGLVYDAGYFDYLGFLCDAWPSAFANPAGTCAYLESIGIATDASNLNLASIGVAQLAGSETVARTVTNVGPAGTYTVMVEAPSGIDVVVNPASLTLGTGESATYDVTFTNVSAPVEQWAFGSLTWSDGFHHVRSPIAVYPLALAAPAEVMGAGTDGSLSFDVTFGYGGDYTAGTHGLAAADMKLDTVMDDPANDINAALETCDWSSFPYQCVGITWHAFEVPEGAAYARFSLFDDYTDGADDLDLYVWGPDDFYGSSGGGTSAEEVNALLPSPGTYEIAVHGWQTDGPDANYTLFNWTFGLVDDRDNMTVTAPAAAVLGATETITVDWAGLDAGTKYLGAVSHSKATELLGLTLIHIDTD